MLAIRMMKTVLALGVVGALAAASGGAVAGAGYDQAYEVVSSGTIKPGDAVPAPQGEVILTVSGKVAKPNGADGVAFDLKTLEQIGLVRFTTSTEWTDGPVEFEGVLLKDLLSVLHADKDADKLVLRALNDYISSMPISDADDYPVMLALKENGQYMSVRDRGPLWVVYPQDTYPEVGRREFLSRWVWQLAEITVE
jgi:hypothetical protein